MSKHFFPPNIKTVCRLKLCKVKKTLEPLKVNSSVRAFEKPECLMSDLILTLQPAFWARSLINCEAELEPSAQTFKILHLRMESTNICPNPCSITDS